MVLNCQRPPKKKRRCAKMHKDEPKESSSSCGPPALGCYGIAGGSLEDGRDSLKGISQPREPGLVPAAGADECNTESETQQSKTKRKKTRGQKKKLTGDQRAERKVTQPLEPRHATLGVKKNHEKALAFETCLDHIQKRWAIRKA